MVTHHVPAWLLMLVLAVGTAGAMAAEWTDTRAVGPFVCRADFSLADSAGESLLGQLALLQSDLTRGLAIPPAKEPIEVYLFHDQATYARALASYLPGVPYRRALYCKGSGPGRVFAYRSAPWKSTCDTNALMPSCMRRWPKCRCGSMRG